MNLTARELYVATCERPIEAFHAPDEFGPDRFVVIRLLSTSAEPFAAPVRGDVDRGGTRKVADSVAMAGCRT